MMRAGMATRLQSTAHGSADVVNINVNMAGQCDFVATARYSALHQYRALRLAWILVLPTRKLVNAVSTRQLDIDVENHDAAFFVAGAAAFVRAGVVAAFLHSVAWLRTIDGLV